MSIEDFTVSDFFKRYISRKNPIIKITDCDFILRTDSKYQNASIGFRVRSNAKAGNLDGRIDIETNFIIPDFSNKKIPVDKINFDRIFDNLEFIKCLNEYPRGQTVDTIVFKK